MPLETLKDGRKAVPLIVAAEALPINESAIHPVVSAKTGKTIHYFQSASEADCNAACDAAWKAFSHGIGPNTAPWKRAGVAERRNLLNRVADLFAEREQELLASQMEETSCSIPWAKNNIDTTVNYVREIAACISSIKGVIPPNDKPNTMSFVFKEAIGPILVIPPWNASLVLSTRALASAIGAGCTTVLKASELSPHTHSLIHDIFVDAGAPKGVINLVMSDRSNTAVITERLISNEHIRKVDFIGSAAVGKIVAATAAKHLKPVLMELGGKCPAIVLDDANIEQAAEMCAKGAFLHHGQICFSTERIIAQKAIADQLADALVKVTEKCAAEEFAGSAVSEGIARHAYEVLQDATSNGARLLAGDIGYKEGEKNSLKPAIISVSSEATPESLRIVDEETFGPSTSLYVVDTEEEAIKIANRSAYGLNASVHTRDMERGFKVARELEYGQVHLNWITVYTSATAPQGGVKGSGWGRQNAAWGLQEFLEDKSITWHGK